MRRGQTMAVWKAGGKDPVGREVLTMSVMKGRSCGRHWENPEAGIGSRSQDLKDISFEVFSFLAETAGRGEVVSLRQLQCLFVSLLNV